MTRLNDYQDMASRTMVCPAKFRLDASKVDQVDFARQLMRDAAALIRRLDKARNG